MQFDVPRLVKAQVLKFVKNEPASELKPTFLYWKLEGSSMRWQNCEKLPFWRVMFFSGSAVWVGALSWSTRFKHWKIHQLLNLNVFFWVFIIYFLRFWVSTNLSWWLDVCKNAWFIGSYVFEVEPFCCKSWFAVEFLFSSFAIFQYICKSVQFPNLLTFWKLVTWFILQILQNCRLLALAVFELQFFLRCTFWCKVNFSLKFKKF